MRVTLLSVLFAVLLVAAPARAADPVHFQVSAGLGLPELVHVSAGGYPLPRLGLDAHWGWVVFNHMVGASVTGHLLGTVSDGRPPHHSLLLCGQVLMNPTLAPLRLKSGGETLGAYLGTYVGYGLLTDGGFLLRAQAGPMWYAEQGLAVGADFTLALGYAF